MKKQHWVILLVFSLFVFCIWYWGKKDYNDVVANKGITTGYILKYSSGKGTGGFTYSYTVIGEEYSRYSSSYLKDPEYFIGKEFPVAYSRANPEKSWILIFPKDFERYNEVFPDSLQWVMKYYLP